jgi:hypothetical protein
MPAAPSITLTRAAPAVITSPGFYLLRVRASSPQNFPTDKIFVWQSRARANPTAARVARYVDLSNVPEVMPDTTPGEDGLLRSTFRLSEFVTVCTDLATAQETWDLIRADVGQLMTEYYLAESMTEVGDVVTGDVTGDSVRLTVDGVELEVVATSTPVTVAPQGVVTGRADGDFMRLTIDGVDVLISGTPA